MRPPRQSHTHTLAELSSQRSAPVSGQKQKRGKGDACSTCTVHVCGRVSSDLVKCHSGPLPKRRLVTWPSYPAARVH